MSAQTPSDLLQHIQFEGCDVCVIAPEDYDELAAQNRDLLALARQYASECAECGGTGHFDGEVGFEEVCEACADIRGVIERATK